MDSQLFKWIMALAVMLYVPLLFESLRNIRKTNYRHSSEYLKVRATAIYSHVTRFYNTLYRLRTAGGDEPERWPDLDRLYCSNAWNQALQRVQQMEEENGGESLFDWSYWTCADTMGPLAISHLEVIDHTGDQGTVSLTVHNGQMAVPVLLTLVYERNDWYIHEITNSWTHDPRYPYREWRQTMEQRFKDAIA